MLIFEKIPMFKSIYDCAKQIYPELVDAQIVVDYVDTTVGVQLLEGTDEDAGKYKIIVDNHGDDMTIIATFFIAGLAMLVYRLKTGEYVHPIIDEQKALTSEYSEIVKKLTNAYNGVTCEWEYYK